MSKQLRLLRRPAAWHGAITMLPAAAATLAALAVVGCGANQRQLPPQASSAAPAHLASGAPRHIAVVVMENEEYSDIIGSGSTPYINRLARRYALAGQMYAVTHPSLPNYLALTGGSTHGIDSDCTDCTVPGSGLAGQLSRAGITWKAYLEDLPHPCFTGGEAGSYAKKHNPFAYYRGLIASRALCSHTVGLSQLARDERRRALPRFIWITPNLCHDMHDCDPGAGDRFLARLLPPLLARLGPQGLLFVTWDEGSSGAGCCRLAHGGHVVTILAGGQAKPGGRLNTPVDHYSLLRTIEDLLGVRRLGGAACPCTPSLQGMLRNRQDRSP